MLISSSSPPPTFNKTLPPLNTTFRQQPDKVKYFYILNDLDSGLSLFDEQVWVSPDNNIPSLNERAENNQLGADLDTILTLTNSLCPRKTLQLQSGYLHQSSVH